MPTGDDISALTDWVELRISSADTAGIALARLDRLLKAEGTDLAAEELGESEEDDVELELTLDERDAAAGEVDVRVEMIRQEVLERARVGARVYPFTADGERVRPRGACGADTYRLLLVLSASELPYRSERRAHEVEEAFDHIAMAALRRFLGRDATGVRFARTAREGDAQADTESLDPQLRPIGFVEAIAWLRNWLDAGRGRREVPVDVAVVQHWEDEEQDEPPPLGRAPLSSYNDAGVDVVVWWKFSDGRRGFPVLLAQCTVQLAWERKLSDISLDLWRGWIDFDTVPPQRALVIPFADRRDHPQWPDRTLEAGIILDRIRLLELLDELQCEELEALIDDRVRSWTQAELRAA
jgi:hypothetical protein